MGDSTLYQKRLLTLWLQGCEGFIWAEALKAEQIISRILWIAENALNAQLLEKSAGSSSYSYSTYVGLGLSSLLVKLLAFEMSTLKGERIPERNFLNKELVQLVKELIELPDKFEGIFDVFPFASDDTEAKNAIWSIIARLITMVKENEMSPSIFRFLVSILANKLDLIEDGLLVRPLGHQSSGTKTDARVIAMKRISNILSRWKFSDDRVNNTSFMGDYVIKEDNVDKLLDLLLLSFIWI
ncbi:hypothetical protein PHJA_001682800 [Phtheirospermum japonicum]|uniref:Uncharacterized protein n=1 Tax=Phtheirospermum japonicum TaxID=374723 RepID=A0A830CJX4_9LAMI|nr:hypothetical protein PHJA_001682800 [Phtheirospermum japonicum]